MMTYLAMKMFCLENRRDILRIELLDHPDAGHAVEVIFNDHSVLIIRVEDARTARSVHGQLRAYLHP